MSVELWIFVVLVVAALITSAISAMLGMAGGVTLLGVMTALLPPAAVVPLHGVVQLCSNSTRTLVLLKSVRWKIFLIYALPLAAGVYASYWVYSGDKLSWFKPAIGAFILVFLVYRRYKPRLRNPATWIYAPLGLFVGFLTVFVGATGPFIAPFFFRDDFTKENVIATKAICQTWGHILKIPFFAGIGFNYAPHLWPLTGLVAAVIVGTLLGKKALNRMSQKTFSILFQTVLAGIALYLILLGIWDQGTGTGPRPPVPSP